MKYRMFTITAVTLASLAVFIVFTETAKAQLVLGNGEQPFGSNNSAAATSPEARLTRIQQKLATLGYDPGPIGTESQKTTVAITTFQVRNGLNPDGMVSESVDAALTVAVNAQRNGANVANESANGNLSAAAGASDEQDPCLEQQLGQTASASNDARGRLNAARRLLGRFGRRNEVVEEVSEAASDVAGTASDTAQIIRGNCQQ